MVYTASLNCIVVECIWCMASFSPSTVYTNQLEEPEIQGKIV